MMCFPSFLRRIAHLHVSLKPDFKEMWFPVVQVCKKIFFLYAFLSAETWSAVSVHGKLYQCQVFIVAGEKARGVPTRKLLDPS